MNREIKFRAWVDNGFIKEMHYEIDMNSADAISLWHKVGFINQYPENLLIKEWQKEIVWMQFTGLTDKNGKEIYEGDILLCHEYDSRDYCASRIIQTFGNAVVGFNHGSFYYYPKGNMNCPHQLLMYAYMPEVIGNIYENPELLNEQI
jgi:uncharacterized phage protein (TIGR01671 family)